MRCRRCDSTRLIRLDKKCSRDNDVFRCQECGFLFSPSTPAGAIKQQVTLLKPQGPMVAREPLVEPGLRPAAEGPEKASEPAGSGNQTGHLPAEKGQSSRELLDLRGNSGPFGPLVLAGGIGGLVVLTLAGLVLLGVWIGRRSESL